MSTRRKLAVALLVLVTLGMVYLTYIEWLVVGIGNAIDFGEPKGPLNGYGLFVGGAVVSLALFVVTVFVAVRGSRTTRRDRRNEMAGT